MVELGQYFDIYLNLSLLTTGVFDGSQLRSDIIGKRLDGTFDIFEFASKSHAGGKQLELLRDYIAFYDDLRNVNLSIFIEW